MPGHEFESTIRIDRRLRSPFPSSGDVFVAKERKTVIAAADRPRRRVVTVRTETEGAQPVQYLDVQRVSALVNELEAAERLLARGELTSSSNLSRTVLKRLLSGSMKKLTEHTREGLQRLAQEHASHPVGQQLQEELAKPRKSERQTEAAQRKLATQREDAREERERRRGVVEELRGILTLPGVTQEKLADLTGIHQPNISRLLQGRSVPRADIAERIQRAIAVIKAEHEEVDVPQE